MLEREKSSYLIYKIKVFTECLFSVCISIHFKKHAFAFYKKQKHVLRCISILEKMYNE